MPGFHDSLSVTLPYEYDIVFVVDVMGTLYVLGTCNICQPLWLTGH